jgi:large repetitive protein
LKKLFALVALFACVATLSAANAGTKTLVLGTGSIAGTITDSVTGQPIAGAMVMAGCGHNATTGGDGTYIIENLAAGDYAVRAMKCGVYAMKTYAGSVHVGNGPVTGIDIALAPIGGGGEGSISGTVYDKTSNAPIAGAKVMAGCCGGKYAMSGSDGTYTITGLADGSYTVRAMKDGYKCATYPDPVVIEDGGAATEIDFYLVSTPNRALY